MQRSLDVGDREPKAEPGPVPIDEQWLREIFDLAPVAMILAEEAGRIVLANQQAETMLGFARQALVGLEVADLVPDAHRERHAALTAAYGQHPVSRPMGAGRVLQAKRADGTLLAVEISLTPIRRNGRMLVLGALVDHGLRERQERRFECVVEASPTAMLMADPQGRIVLVNRETERLFGYARFELVGQSVEVLVPANARERHADLRANFTGAPNQSLVRIGRELLGLRKDGAEIPIEIGLTPIRMEEGEMTLAVIVDISARRHLSEVERANAVLEERVRQRTLMLERQHQELVHAMRALEQRNVELKQFAYVASHDLQTPLRSISGHLELIDRRCGPELDDTKRSWIRSAIDAAQRMSNLIRQVLEYSRLEVQPTRLQDVDLAEVVAEALRTLDAAIAGSKAVVECGTLPAVEGDRTELLQVFHNLIGNAIKYRGGSPPHVLISAVEQHDEWSISVQDNGIGIPPEARDKVFDIFRRFHSAREIPGSGIGLAVCRRLVQRHGGQIRAEAGPDGGSILTFTLPKRRRKDGA